MIFGMCTWTEACRIRGKVSRNLLYWKKNLPKEKCVRSEIDKSSNDYQTRSCVARSMEKWAKPLRIERNKTGKTRSHNSTVLEDWEECTSLILQMRSSRMIFCKKKRWESGKDPWHQPCRAREWFTLAPRRWKESRKLKSGISWIHKTTTGSSPPTKHEDYIAGKGFRWPITMCRKFIPMPQAMKIPDAKAAVDKEWKKLETIPAWNMEKVKKQEGGHCRSTKRQNRKSTLLNCDGHMPPKKRWGRTKITEAYWPSRTPWWHCERRLWSLRSFYWTGLVCVSNDCRKSNGCYCEITWLWRTSSWRSICLYPSKIGGRSRIAQSSKVRISRYMDTSFMTHKWPKSWANIEDPVVLLERNLYGHSQAGLSWEKTFRGRSSWSLDGKKYQIGNVCLFNRKQGSFLSENVDDMKMHGKEAEYGSHVEQIDEKRWFWRTKYFWDVLNVNANRMNLKNTQRCLNHIFLQEQLKSYQDVESLTQQRWHGLMIWKDMLENALSDAAKWWEKDRAVIQSFKSLFGWLLILNRNKLNQ